jgi:hypothetical protein
MLENLAQAIGGSRSSYEFFLSLDSQLVCTSVESSTSMLSCMDVESYVPKVVQGVCTRVSYRYGPYTKRVVAYYYFSCCDATPASRVGRNASSPENDVRTEIWTIEGQTLTHCLRPSPHEDLLVSSSRMQQAQQATRQQRHWRVICRWCYHC